MSNTDRLVIWLHVAFVVFTIGPVSIAILSTPRYIRHRNVAVLRYLLRMTRIFGVASLGVLAFGIVAAQELKKLSSVWVTTAMTLFVVSLVLLVLIMRDQRKAVVALETSAEHEALATANHTGEEHEDAPDAPDAGAIPLGSPPAGQAPVANVERGRIASLAGIVTLIWLVILVLMVWNS
jgi:choline-glycine betaine transporter